jgi:nucleoside-diphosphate-sugar epimerase
MTARQVLITGGAGSLGQELGLRLYQSGHRLTVLDLPSRDFGSLEALDGVRVVRGDITDPDAMASAVSDVDVVIHLAALLPPASERDRELTWAVNVTGTENLVEALVRAGRDAHLVFSSSVCVYGDTSGDTAPIRVDHPLSAQDIYAETKIAAERAVREGSVRHTLLRISGISVPAFLAPPAVWPFMPDQRIEFVARPDVVAALAAAVDWPQAAGGALNIAGGATWQMLGREYVAAFNGVMGLDPEDAVYLAEPGYFDWYDTESSQARLKYQCTSFPRFLDLLEESVAEAVG